MVKRADYSAAKEHIVSLTQEYATEMLPSWVDVKITIKNLDGDRDRNGFITHAQAGLYGTIARVDFNSSLIRTNVYNIHSAAFNKLIRHELCHIRHSIDEPLVPLNSNNMHLRKAYIDCVKRYTTRAAAYSKTHPATYSIRAYLGSENKLVPYHIRDLLFYHCEKCGYSSVWNMSACKHRPFSCEKCSSEVIWTYLKPFDAYRVAVANGFDTVLTTLPARYFVYDREDF